MGFTTNPIITGIDETFPIIGTSRNYNSVGGYNGPRLALNFLGNSLPNGVTFDRASNATQFDEFGRLVWAPANLLLNTDALGTQTVSAGFTAGAPLTLSFTGTGSVALSGGGSGTLAGAGAASRASLNFTTTTGSVTFTVTGDVRAAQLERTGIDSPKTYLSAAGSQQFSPRFDYNPATLAPRGLLLEETRTNFASVSEPTTGSGAIITTAPTALLGVTTARRLTGDGVLTQHFTTVSATTQTGTTVYTVSCYVRYVDCQFVQLATTLGASVATDYANFDLIAGTVSAVGATATATIQVIGGGVFRITMTYTSVAAPTVGSPLVLVICASGTDARLPTNTSVQSVDFMGQQAELGAFATSLIPTFGTAATRASETGTGVLSNWGATESTVYAAWETTLANAAVFPPAVSFNDGTTNNRVHMSTALTASTVMGIMHSVTGGVNDVNSGLPPAVSGTVCRAAFRAKLNDFAGCTAGGAITTDTSAQYPTGINRFDLGSSGTSAPVLQRWIREIRYYNTGLTNTQLQALTA